jgi:hypothetical protein
VLSLLNKTIVCLKTLFGTKPLTDDPTLRGALATAIDVLVVASTDHNHPKDAAIRILQTTFSLIDHSLIPLFTAQMLTRIFLICFQFCQEPSIVQNVSVSALLALTELLLKFGGVP